MQSYVKLACFFSGFPPLRGNAEALDRSGGKTKHRLISYFLSNSNKNYRNWITYVRLYQVKGRTFFWDTMYSVPAQETVKHYAKFGWPTLSNVSAVTKPRCETRWNLLGCPKPPKRPQPLVPFSGPTFSILWGYVEEILLFNKFFPIVNTCHSYEDIAQQSCAMVRRWQFLA